MNLGKKNTSLQKSIYNWNWDNLWKAGGFFHSKWENARNDMV